MKKNLLKILFILSFFPIIFLIYILMDLYLNGINSPTLALETYYGFEALKLGMKIIFGFENVGKITMLILTICLIYQVFYIKRVKEN